MKTHEEILKEITSDSVLKVELEENMDWMKPYIIIAMQEVENQTREEMYLNMQYYYEYCLSKGYVTPQEWIEKHKHWKSLKK
jgi:hypothetical protein